MSPYSFAPSMSSSPYYWHRAPWLYIKWGKPNHYPVKRPHGKFGLWFKLPDREIIICHESERPRQVDEAIDLNPFTSPLYQDTDYFLIGQGSGRRPAPHHQWHRKGYQVLTDSGGAQLRTGTDWVRPQAALDFMNLSGDIGVVLDMPLRATDSNDLASVTKLAKAQGKLSDWMMKARRHDLEILNVAHGETLEQFNLWRKIVEDARMIGWAVTEDWHLGLLLSEQLDCHLHCLGLGSLYPSVAWAGKYTNIVTSDSSTWSTTFRNSNIPFQDADAGAFDYAMMGGTKRYANHQFHNKGRLACSCTICAKVGWFFPFVNARGQDIRFLVANHVLLTQFQQADALNHMAQESPNVERYVDKIVEWMGGTGPDNQPRAQLRDKNDEYNPRWCAFCGREADRGKGDFPTCRAHTRLAGYVSGIYMMEEAYRDPDSIDTGKAIVSAKKTGDFGVNRLFGKPETLFKARQGTHLSSMASKAGATSGLSLAQRYVDWTENRGDLCVCFAPKIELNGTGGNPLNPTTPPYTATCGECKKSYPLPSKTKRTHNPRYQILIGGEKRGEPMVTMSEALKRINDKWDEFVASGGRVEHVTISKRLRGGEDEGDAGPWHIIQLTVNRRGKVTSLRAKRTKTNGKTSPTSGKGRRAKAAEVVAGAGEEKARKTSNGKRDLGDSYGEQPSRRKESTRIRP